MPKNALPGIFRAPQYSLPKSSSLRDTGNLARTKIPGFSVRNHCESDQPPRVHPTAVVSDSARLGAGVSIGPFCVIDNGVEIGDGCVLGPHVTIFSGTTLGKDCRIHAGGVLGDLPQDQAFRDAVTFVHIGARSIIRECATVHRGTKPGTTTAIGDDCLPTVEAQSRPPAKAETPTSAG